MERKSFVFYKEWMDAIKDLPDDVRLEIYESIVEYATTGNVRGLKPMAKIAFNFIKTTIDRDTKKYLGIVERNRNNGNKGGRPKGETHDNPNNPTKPTGFFGNPNNLDNDNDNDNEDNKLSSPLPPKGERGGDFYLSSPLSKKDGIPRNYEGLCDNLNRLKISPKEQDTIIKLSNFGEIGSPVWIYIQQCLDSITKSTSDKSRIKMPGRYIISKMKEEHGT